MNRYLVFVIIVLLAAAMACGTQGGTADPGSGGISPGGGSDSDLNESPRIGPGANLPPTWTPVPTVQSVTPQVAGEEGATPEAPSANGQETYIVQPGDTLAEIAAAYGVSVETLAAANNIENIDIIEVDQVLVIPR
ncbi:MAG: LysM peptidoglycan-binding domain-containing protein [Candidatus Promineifilaceae bacterium]